MGEKVANYEFERLNVLLAEDSTFLSSLMLTCLHELGVQNIKTAAHGGEAIDILKLTKTNPNAAGILSVDLIISNWQMAPVDGMMLLRWVRRHKESPNRFLPVFMVSANSDGANVCLARDMGVTEFMTKPFSIQSFADRLVQVIERPRQFIQNSEYFGPDRRRKAITGMETERRVLTESCREVEVIYG